MMSAPVPGAIGTIARIGLVGHGCCAAAGPQAQASRPHATSNAASLRLRHAALIPCRLCEASFTVKNTTSPAPVALPEWTAFDGM